MSTVDMYPTLDRPAAVFTTERRHPWRRTFINFVGGLAIVGASLYLASGFRHEAAKDRDSIPSATAQVSKSFGIPTENEVAEAPVMDKLADGADALPFAVGLVAVVASAVERRRQRNY